MNHDLLNQLLPTGVVAERDPNDVATFALTAQHRPIGSIQIVGTGWLALGVEEADGSAPVFGIFANPYDAAHACLDAVQGGC